MSLEHEIHVATLAQTVRTAAATLPSPPFPVATIRLLTTSSGESSPAHVLASMLAIWARTGTCPVNLAPGVSPFAASDRASEQLSLLWMRTPAVCAAVGPGATAANMRDLLAKTLGPSGVSLLFALRLTPGSLPGAVAPSHENLRAAAFTPVRCGSRELSVAGRALEKHIGRRGTGWGTSFWGSEDEQGGPVEAKNRRAEGQVNRILSEATWWNVLALPGGEPAVEVRVASGHGARWHYEDGSFRGFLEPHSEEAARRCQ